MATANSVIPLGRFRRQAAAIFEMCRSVGLRPAAERVTNYFRARTTEYSRAKQFKRLGLTGIQTRRILGSKMKLDPAEQGLDRDLLLDGIREPVATGHILSILGEEDVVLEVGANIGYYALIESRICKKIYAAEPHPRNFQRLQENISRNLRTNIEAHNIAFGQADGPIFLACSSLSNWHSCKNVDASDTNTIEIAGFKIDSFFEEREAPTFIKMDVEGYELEVLRGARKTLARANHLFLEIHGDILSENEIRECLDMIAESGLAPSLIVQYDRPGMSKIYPNEYLKNIYAGDRGTFELFFERP
ncbi:MAG: FkbM family methyltransferase [Pseudomonadota bacterium]